MVFTRCVRGYSWPFYYRLLLIMKLAIFLTLGLAFNALAEANAQKITLNVKNTPLYEVMQELQKQQGYSFLFHGKHLSDIRVDAQLRKVEFADAMDMILTDRGLDWSLEDGIVTITERRSPPRTVNPVSQQRDITGKVTDKEGNPLEGVTVTIKGTSSAVTTDAKGDYRIPVAQNAESLVFTIVGFETTEREVSTQDHIDVSLHVSVSDLDEVVVVGYGTQLKSTITGAVKQLDGAELASQASINTSAALMGKVPGVQVIQNSGQPGANEGTIRIRGVGTLGDASPLVLIDGVPGNINNVPSLDIENITVLKDAASAAVYGSRAANGVILVTTKRGAVGKPRIAYETFVGLQNPTNQPKFVDGATFMTLQNLGSTNVGASPVWSEDYIAEWRELHSSDPDNYPATDWIKEAFSRQGMQQRHALSVSGGADWINYLSSISFDDEQSSIPNYGFKRYSFRLNSDIRASDALSFDFDVNIARRDQTNPSQGIGRIITDIYRVPAVYVSTYTHGGWGPAFNLHNPIAYIHDGGLSIGSTTDSRLRLGGTFKPIEGLTFSFVYSPVQSIDVNKSMVKQYEITDENGEIAQMMPEKNSLSQSYSSTFNHNVNALVNYETNIDEHELSAMAGYEFLSSKTSGFSASRTDFQIQDLEELDAGSVGNQLNSGSASEWSLLSFFGRLNYGYQRKYLVEGNLRYDGSSRFEGKKKWSLFPSFSLGWVISEEGFLKDISSLNHLKVRGSWGILGNQEIGNYPFVATMNLDQGYMFGSNPVSGAAQTSLSNPNITWERSENSNIGVDISLLNNRLNITYDYFVRNTSNILLRLPIPLIIGLTAPYQNAGEVRNTGSELEIGYQNTSAGGLTYSSSFNISYVKNRIVNLEGTGPFISGSRIDKEGYPINSLFGYRSSGLFQSVAEIESHAQQVGQIAPGDIRYADLKKDEVINADDRTIIGNSFPALNYGLNLSLRYKGVDFSAFLQGVGKRDVLLSGYAAWPLYNGTNIRKWQAEDFWTSENPNASMPRLTAGTSHSNFEVSDFWVFDASYIRLRNIQVGYTIPEKYTDKVRMTSVRLFFLGENMFTRSKMPAGVDPNVPNGDTYFPISKLYSFGININL